MPVSITEPGLGTKQNRVVPRKKAAQAARSRGRAVMLRESSAGDRGQGTGARGTGRGHGSRRPALTLPLRTMFWLPHSTDCRLTLLPEACGENGR